MTLSPSLEKVEMKFGLLQHNKSIVIDIKNIDPEYEKKKFGHIKNRTSWTRGLEATLIGSQEQFKENPIGFEGWVLDASNNNYIKHHELFKLVMSGDAAKVRAYRLEEAVKASKAKQKI
jgi:hypothetical protein